MKKKRIGVIGTFVWDTIHGRGGRSVPLEEWGGIAYTLSGLDAALPDDWEIVPILKVGHDLSARANTYIRTLKHIAQDAALIEVPYLGHRVEIRYHDDERRAEFQTGNIPPWTWLGLKPLIDTAKLDALYVNFLSGWELDLETAQLLRANFHGPIHADLHMMVMAVQANGMRIPKAMPNVAAWCRCFDFLQMNEEEMAVIAPDAMSLSATAIAAGVSCMIVTLGKRGAVYVSAPGFENICDLPSRSGLSTSPRGGRTEFGAVRTGLIEAPEVVADGDPTGCGDVYGSTWFSRMLAGDNFSDAMRIAAKAAARNVQHRGATGLAAHLRGEISLT